MAIPVDHYAVLGNPIKHSKSPRIHAMFAESVNHRLNYSAQEVAEDGFKEALEKLLP